MAETTYGKDRRHRNQAHLLDEEELNIGSSQQITVPVNRPFLNTAVAAGKEVRLLDLQTESKKGRTVSIVMAQTIQETEENPLQNTSGPITGIVEFTSGAAGLIRVEFDIPSISRLPVTVNSITELVNSNVAPAGNTYPPSMITPALSGVSLCVPASSLRVYARNDNNMALIWDTRVIIGSFGASDKDPTVNAAVYYGEVFGANKHLKKTVYIAQSQDETAPNVDVVPIPPGGSAVVGIPPFAKSVRFPRRPLNTTSLQVNFDTYFGLNFTPYDIAVGSDGPIEVPPGAFRLIVSNSSAATSVNDLAAIFDLAI